MKISWLLSIKKPILGDSYILTHNNQKIKFKDVKYYKNMDGFFHSLPGVFSRNLFAERVEHGKIDLFSRMSISTTPDTHQTYSYFGSDASNTTPGTSFITRVDYYKKNNGPLLSANYKNLKDDLSDNQQSMKYLSEYKTLSYIQLGTTVASVGFFIGGVSEASQNEGIPSDAKTMFTLAGVFSGATYLLYMLKPNKVQKAIKAYNQ